MKKKLKRQALTLVEIMLVVVLIGIVGSSLAINLKGSLNHGKKFKTQQIQKNIQTALRLEGFENNPNEIVNGNWQQAVAQSPLMNIKLKDNQILDAWGAPFEASYDEDIDEFKVVSKHIDADGNIH